ncbi:MAG: HlyD family efflux transporter periplasmic adaptor subunit, partial [Delftia sp.]|nr:HlyD family efflux transporter periplasmic adaptor subunit [Delftia sp.]
TRLQRLVLRTSHLEVRSPVAGLLVGRSLPAVGQWCEAGHELARIADPSANLVEVVVPPTWDAAAVRSAELEAGDGVLLAARVISLSPGVDPQRGGRVLTLKPEAESDLVGGATLTARLRVLMRESALAVPVEAVLNESGQTRVVVGPAAGKQDRLQSVSVICGPSDGKEVVIESGLDGGTWVVLHRPGSSRDDYWSSSLFLGVGR